MYKTIVSIKGMHCRSCELLIHEELSQVPGVDHIRVSHRQAQAELQHRTPSLDSTQIATAIAKAGYQIGVELPQSWVSRNFEDYQYLVQAGGILAIVYLLITFTGVSKFLNLSSISSTQLPLIFLIGLTAGLSTCMAVVGGLVLSLSARFNQQHPYASASQKLRPQLFFNLGRVVSYTLLGGVIGIFGSLISLSTSFLGVLTLGIGVIMVIFGLQLTGISPRLATLSLTLPSSLARFFGLASTKSDNCGNTSALLTGAATFFLPCGFTQTMQLLAMASGSFIQGALIMGIFALGTLPGLLGVGGLASIIKGELARKFYAFAGLVILFFAWINLSSGWQLTGAGRVLAAATKPQSVVQRKQAAPTALTATFRNRTWLMPQQLQTTVGSPTTLEVDVLEGGAGCTGTITIPGLYNSYEPLQTGNSLSLAFTPTAPGVYPVTCGMGMVTFGQIIVN